jgi:hypothetical protein
MLEVRFEDDYVREEFLTMDGTHIFILDVHLNIMSKIAMGSTAFCASYLMVNEHYLLLCDNSLLLANATTVRAEYVHGLSLNFGNRNDYELQRQTLKDNEFVLCLLDHNVTARLYRLSVKEGIIEHVNNYQFHDPLEDLKMVKKRVLVLQDGKLCFMEDGSSPSQPVWRKVISSCYSLNTIIPSSYASSYSYEEIIPYYSSNSTIRALVLARDAQDLHIDLQIDMSLRAFSFEVINAYAGYVGYRLREIISVNMTLGSYSYFMLLYHQEGPKDKHSCMVAYYQYNARFGIDRVIGQIRSA